MKSSLKLIDDFPLLLNYNPNSLSLPKRRCVVCIIGLLCARHCANDFGGLSHSILKISLYMNQVHYPSFANESILEKLSNFSRSSI